MMTMAVTNVVYVRFLFNPKLLEGVDTSKKTTEIGDFVLVIDDSFMIEARQDKEHGGWVETMRKVYIHLVKFFRYNSIVVSLTFNLCRR